jgi:hypothetical protein
MIHIFRRLLFGCQEQECCTSYSLRAGCSGIWIILVVKDFSLLWNVHSPIELLPGLFPQDVKLTTHIFQEPRLRMSCSVPALLHTPLWQAWWWLCVHFLYNFIIWKGQLVVLSCACVSSIILFRHMNRFSCHFIWISCYYGSPNIRTFEFFVITNTNMKTAVPASCVMWTIVVTLSVECGVLKFCVVVGLWKMLNVH